MFPAIKAPKKTTLGTLSTFHRGENKDNKDLLYSPSLSSSPHCPHLLLIFRRVEWPLLWCLQVSEECSMPGSSLVLLTCPWLYSPPVVLCYVRRLEPSSTSSCQVLFLLLMVQSYSDATLHRCISLALPLRASSSKRTHTPDKSLLTLDAFVFSSFCVSCLTSVLISNSTAEALF